MNVLWAIHRMRRGPRRLCKGLVLAAVMLGVTYPHLSLLPRAIRHAGNMDALIDETAPELEPLRTELNASLASIDEDAHSERLSAVQKLVEERIPYEWDWNTWGVVEYTPTVAEVIAQGREDCDGQAVVAASLLKGIGYEPRLVTDLRHVWVWTEHGETMSPGGAKLFDPTDDGRRFNLASVVDWPISLAVGLAVFPIVRELIVLAAVWLLGISPLSPRWTWALSLFLLAHGLLLIHVAGNPGRIVSWAVWLGLANVAAGLVVLWF